MSRWPMVPLGEMLRQTSDPHSVRADQDYPNFGIYSFGRGLFVKQPISGARSSARTLYRVQSGQFIYSRLFAFEGAYGLVTEEYDGYFVSNEYPTFECDRSRLDPAYLATYFRWPKAWEGTAVLSTGLGDRRRRIQPEQLVRHCLPLPPLAEQRRLVERIDALAAKIEAAKRLRQEARQESESFIPARIAQLLGSVDGVPVAISHVADVRGGIQKSPDRAPGNNPVRYLTVAHVHRDRIRLDEPRFFEVRPSELDRWRLMAGDVLIIEGNGSADQIGRTALFRGEIDPCVHQNHVIRIRPDQGRVYPEFLSLYLNSPVGQDAVQARSRTTSGLRSLSVGRIKEIEVRLPDISAQRQIVESTQELRRSFQRVIEMVDATTKELDAMLPAILDRAFRGEL